MTNLNTKTTVKGHIGNAGSTKLWKGINQNDDLEDDDHKGDHAHAHDNLNNLNTKITVIGHLGNAGSTKP